MGWWMRYDAVESCTEVARMGAGGVLRRRNWIGDVVEKILDSKER